MGDRSTHFSDWEFACGDGRCPHCGGLVAIDDEFVASLEAFRSCAGGRTVTVTSGYRCPIRNARTSGASRDSLPLAGLACDVHVEGMSAKQMYEAALGVPDFKNGGIGVYAHRGASERDVLHLDSRGRFARWARLDDEAVDLMEALCAA